MKLSSSIKSEVKYKSDLKLKIKIDNRKLKDISAPKIWFVPRVLAKETDDLYSDVNCSIMCGSISMHSLIYSDSFLDDLKVDKNKYFNERMAHLNSLLTGTKEVFKRCNPASHICKKLSVAFEKDVNYFLSNISNIDLELTESDIHNIVPLDQFYKIHKNTHKNSNFPTEDFFGITLGFLDENIVGGNEDICLLTGMLAWTNLLITKPKRFRKQNIINFLFMTKGNNLSVLGKNESRKEIIFEKKLPNKDTLQSGFCHLSLNQNKVLNLQYWNKEI